MAQPRSIPRAVAPGCQNCLASSVRALRWPPWPIRVFPHPVRAGAGNAVSGNGHVTAPRIARTGCRWSAKVSAGTELPDGWRRGGGWPGKCHVQHAAEVHCDLRRRQRLHRPRSAPALPGWSPGCARNWPGRAWTPGRTPSPGTWSITTWSRCRRPQRPGIDLDRYGMVFTTRLSGGQGGRNHLEAGLRRLGVKQKNGKPNHPETQRKPGGFSRR